MEAQRGSTTSAGRASFRGAAPGRAIGTLHALALVGSRLNQEPHQSGAPSFGPPDYAAEGASLQGQLCAPSLSLLDQLCTVAENEHNAAAQMLSSLAAF